MGHAEGEGLSRITTVVPGTDESISKLVQQIYKLVDIHEVRILIHLACLSLVYEFLLHYQPNNNWANLSV